MQHHSNIEVRIYILNEKMQVTDAERDRGFMAVGKSGVDIQMILLPLNSSSVTMCYGGWAIE